MSAGGAALKTDRYSRVARRIWADEKFRALSPAPPNAQTLWLRLLTAPEQTAIPGVIVAWEAGLAQSLGWPLKGFREAFGEALALGMLEGHFEAGLVWVPKAIEHNRPESPNVIRSWRHAWIEVPECDLKNRIHSQLYAFVEGLGEGFRKAFRQALGEALPEGSRDPSPNTRARLPLQSDLDLPDPDLSDPVLAKDLTGSARARGSGRSRKPPAPQLTDCPADFEARIMPGVIAWAEKRGWPAWWVEIRLEDMREKYAAKGLRYADWGATARAFLKAEVEQYNRGPEQQRHLAPKGAPVTLKPAQQTLEQAQRHNAAVLAKLAPKGPIVPPPEDTRRPARSGPAPASAPANGTPEEPTG